MRSFRVVRLNAFEAEVLDRVVTSLNVGWPTWAQHQGGPRPEVRALVLLSRRSQQNVGHETLALALAAVEQQAAVCRREADPANWHLEDAPPDHARAIEVIVDARALQAREAERARALLERALALTDPVPEGDDLFGDEPLTSSL